MSQPICVGPGQGCMYCSGDYGCTDDCKCPGCVRRKNGIQSLVAEVANHLYLLSGRTMPGGLPNERPGFRERYEYRAQELVKFFIQNKARLND